MSFARALTDAANGARKAAEAKNIDALFTAGEDLYNACSSCHRRYASVP
jgi:cytochrome c556